MDTVEPPYIVAIGASGAEGLNDIAGLLAVWPDIEAVVMAVLHRSSDQPSRLQEILARTSRLPVVVAKDGQRLQLGKCYIGEPDEPLTLSTHQSAMLVEGSDNRWRNRIVDLLFNSVAHHGGKKALGIVLSGSLDDGSRGLAAIRAAGGLTMVLDPKLKPVGMQQNAIDYDGPINFIGCAMDIAVMLREWLPRSRASAG